MATRIPIKGDFGSGQSIDLRVATAAAKVVTSNAIDKDDALLLLDMLGIIPPLPGNEVVILKKDRLTDERRAERELTAKKRKDAQEKRVKEFAIQPYEIGEE